MTWIILSLFACGDAIEGDPCASDEDCGDLICHFHDDDAEEGVCEAEDAHDDDDHDTGE